MIASAPNVLVVHPSVPVASVKELIEYARAHPGALNYGSAGVGTVSHLAGALVAATAHVQFVHVPYKGTAAAQVDLLERPAAVHVRQHGQRLGQRQGRQGEGTCRHFAGALAERAGAAHHGRERVSGLRYDGMVRLAGAGGHTGADRFAHLRSALLKGLQTADARKRIAALGAEPGHMTPAEFGRYIHAENARWKKIFADGLVRIEE